MYCLDASTLLVCLQKYENKNAKVGKEEEATEFFFLFASLSTAGNYVCSRRLGPSRIMKIGWKSTVIALNIIPQMGRYPLSIFNRIQSRIVLHIVSKLFHLATSDSSPVVSQCGYEGSARGNGKEEREDSWHVTVVSVRFSSPPLDANFENSSRSVENAFLTARHHRNVVNYTIRNFWMHGN